MKSLLFAIAFISCICCVVALGFVPVTQLPPPQNVVTKWATIYLGMLQSAFPAFSPPVISRVMAIITTSMYDTWTAYDTVALPVYECNELRRPLHADERDEAISFAAYCALKNQFARMPAILHVATDFMVELGYDPNDINTNQNNAAGIGNSRCRAVLQSRAKDGFNQGGTYPGTLAWNTSYADWTNYVPVNFPQSVVALTNCSNELRSLNKWQPLRVPLQTGGTKVQQWLSPHAGQATTFATDIGKLRPIGPPLMGGPTQANVYAQAQEVLSFSEQLNDTQKAIAEFWADGPGSVLPPGHWHRLSLDAARTIQLSVGESTKLLFLQSQAVLDAGIATWHFKRLYDSIRPIQLIQCLFAGQQVDAWSGPYLGVAQIDASEWKPYQNKFFVTPPFAGYPSGHSTFSAASATVLRNYLGSDQYVGSAWILPQGQSLFEPQIDDPLAPNYVAGVTDVPNEGTQTIGYSPSSDIVLQYSTWTEAAMQAGISRLYGGIHIASDNIDGADIGNKVGVAVWTKANKLFNGMRT